jgi:hypothetical protein
MFNFNKSNTTGSNPFSTTANAFNAKPAGGGFTPVATKPNTGFA